MKQKLRNLMCRLFGHQPQWVYHEGKWLEEVFHGFRSECHRCGRPLKWRL